MDAALEEMFYQVERYIVPLLGTGNDSRLSKEENRILALQQINRLNHRIGQLVRSNSSFEGMDLKVLQTYVNNLTLGVKNDNVPQMKSALHSVRNYIRAK